MAQIIGEIDQIINEIEEKKKKSQLSE